MKWKKLFRKHKLPQLIQNDIDNLNSLITVKNIKFVILKWKPELSGLTGAEPNALRIHTILHDLFQEIQDEGTLPYSFYETSTNLAPETRQRQ